MQVQVGGSSCVEARKRWAAAVVERCIEEPRVLGYCVAGFNTGESAEQQAPMLAASLGELPEAALRMASGVSAPHQVRFKPLDISPESLHSLYVHPFLGQHLILINCSGTFRRNDSF